MIVVKDKKEQLRRMRRNECFSVINRGKAWYDLLTVEQESELKAWYEAWLNVTDSLVIPKRPSWLDDKINTEVEYL